LRVGNAVPSRRTQAETVNDWVVNSDGPVDTAWPVPSISSRPVPS
jgi:hypothetical protein